MGAIRTGGEARLILGEAVTGNYFRMLGVRPLAGRSLLPDDDHPGAERVVMISAAFWSATFGNDPHVVGRTLRIGGLPHAIVGVVPDDFRGMTAPMVAPQFWMPLTWIDQVQPIAMETARRSPGAHPAGAPWIPLDVPEGPAARTGDRHGCCRRAERRDAVAGGDVPRVERRSRRDRPSDGRRGGPPDAGQPVARGARSVCWRCSGWCS